MASLQSEKVLPAAEPGGRESEDHSAPRVTLRAPISLCSPAELAAAFPLDPGLHAFIASRRRELARALLGIEERLVVVVGPCSIHSPAAALEYAERLAQAARIYADDLLVVMRVYLEKPRTVGGWKGIINDPGLDESFDIEEGLRIARSLLVEVGRLGLPAGSEFLDTLAGSYYSDLVSWGVIGARTVESQMHRELVSGLEMPVGFKNRSDGDVGVAVDAIRAALLPHCFPAVSPMGAPVVKQTVGNRQTHVVLRGGTRGPNYSADAVQGVVELLAGKGLPPHVMVDCSHANSGKNPRRQSEIVESLAERLALGDRAITGVMIESNLVEGSQDPRACPLVYGQSVTDGCLSWELTLPALEMLAIASRARRRRSGEWLLEGDSSVPA